jgi:hypothetical protein
VVLFGVDIPFVDVVGVTMSDLEQDTIAIEVIATISSFFMCVYF